MRDAPRDATIRKLRAELQRAREDLAALEQRLSYTRVRIPWRDPTETTGMDS